MAVRAREQWRRWAAPALAAAALILGGQELDRRADLEGWALTWLGARVTAAGPRPDPRIVVVGIDEESLRDPRLPHWGPGTLARRAHAELLRRLHDGGATVVGLDIIFDQPADDPLDDMELAAALDEAGPVVLALGAAPDPDRAGGPARFALPPDAFLDAQGLRPASPLVRHWLMTRMTYGIDIDQRENGRLVRPLAWELFQAYREAGWDMAPPAAGVIEGNFMPIRWPRAPVGEAFTIVPYREMWDGSWLRAHPRGVAGKIVLVGQVSPLGAGDVHRTPNGTVPGVLIHASAVQTLLDGTNPRAAPPGIALLLAGVAFVLVAVAARFGTTGWAAGVTIAVVGAAWAGSVAALAHTPSMWLNPLEPTLAALAAFGACVLRQSLVARRALGRFVAPEVARELANTGELAARRGETQEATVLFADVRDYTRLGEQLAPAELMRALNEHFAWADALIERHGGRVDKHIGDALMAVFTGEDGQHAERAVAAAAAMLREGTAAGLRFGIGIHTGPLALGALGGTKLEYGAIGDAVNVAARLEAATKERGVPVLISGETAGRLGEWEGLLPVGELALKGKGALVMAYTLRTMGAGE